MPFALLFVGMLLVISGFQDTYQQLGTQVQKDFTGPGNFVYWLIALGIVGSLGYVEDLKSFSRITMALLIVVIFLSNKGVFAQFNSGIAAGSSAPVNPVGTPLPSTGGTGGGTSGGGGASGSTGGGIGSILGPISAITNLFGF